jgi:hypothetical protein
MTLVEVVVALTVAGLALTTGYGALALIVDRSTQADDVASAAIHEAVMRQTLTEWLAATRVGGPQSRTAFEGLDGEYDGQPDDVVAFLTSAVTPAGARETLIMLYIDREEATPERGLVAALVPWTSAGMPSTGARAPMAADAQQTATVVRRLELAPEATSLDIQYRSGLLGDARWLPSWISTSVPPSGIELRVGAPDSASLPRLLRLPLRVPVRSVR